MFCVQCGIKNQLSAAKFCYSCGAELVKQTVEYEISKVTDLPQLGVSHLEMKSVTFQEKHIESAELISETEGDLDVRYARFGPRLGAVLIDSFLLSFFILSATPLLK